MSTDIREWLKSESAVAKVMSAGDGKPQKLAWWLERHAQFNAAADEIERLQSLVNHYAREAAEEAHRRTTAESKLEESERWRVGVLEELRKSENLRAEVVAARNELKSRLATLTNEQINLMNLYHNKSEALHSALRRLDKILEVARGAWGTRGETRALEDIEKLCVGAVEKLNPIGEPK